VTGWANQAVPVKIAEAGIDRYFERYYRKGPRRRPVRIEFCEADVLDAFDEWRRAVGVTRVVSDPSGGPDVEDPQPGVRARPIARVADSNQRSRSSPFCAGSDQAGPVLAPRSNGRSAPSTNSRRRPAARAAMPGTRSCGRLAEIDAVH
jgi:hypothetical protein